MLQWGRAQVSAEINPQGARREKDRGASMGPRSGERGNDNDGCSAERRCKASMGPRSGERGNMQMP